MRVAALASLRRSFALLPIGLAHLLAPLLPGVERPGVVRLQVVPDRPDWTYWTYNLDDRDRYYFRRVYLGCIRANDFLVSRPRFDGRNLAVTGGSQGGALSIVTAALDPRVKTLAAYYPGLADLTGYLKNRAGGCPGLFRTEKERLPARIATVPYYDVVNFARRVKVPGLYSWGFNDEVCPPTSMYAAYGAISAEKSLLLALETGHSETPEQVKRVNLWLEERLLSR